MSRLIRLFGFFASLQLWFLNVSLAAPANPATVIVCPKKASSLEILSAREIRRYVYLRTGQLLPIVEAATQRGEAIVIHSDATQAAPQAYRLQTMRIDGRHQLEITGGDPVGTLYGVYRFAEHLGVRFYLHGDVIPDKQMAWKLPELHETSQPLFAVRGIQPFHDFPEGPDWWNADDYKAILSQLAKLRMNFLGLHTYPEGGVGPEPLIWIGRPQDVHPDGTVAFSYPARHFTTANVTGAWGNRPKKTSEYSFGAANLFDRDNFGPDYMRGMSPFTNQTPEQSNELFDRMGRVLNDAFSFAHKLGIKTCIGTETPLTIPKVLQERLIADGQDPKESATIQALYEGMFQRILKTHPLDYYWFWTPEGWTWRGTTDAQVAATVRDLKLAFAAARRVHATFTLGTCGWVLGPPQDRALFDRKLPKEAPMSCINRNVGFSPVEPGFADISGRPQWAIPWMEDDPGLTIPQLWAGRMRRDAADAHAYGCTGLLGIHWRTRILGPNIAALAHAAWDQKAWNPDFGKRFQPPPKPARIEGRLGGNVAAFPTHAMADTEEDPIYQTVRWAIRGYHLKVPNGSYRVTLKFCEPHYREKGKRVFSVKLQGESKITQLDVFATVGPDKALDDSFEHIGVKDGWLMIDFVPVVEHPLIAALVVEQQTNAAGKPPEKPCMRRINSAGPAWGDYSADLEDVSLEALQDARPRDLPVADFYADWSQSQFGPEAAEPLAKLFASLDGSPSIAGRSGHQANLPRPATWVHGPGGIKPDSRPWSQVKAEYAFVDKMAALRPRVKGPGNLERFDYWLNQFRYLRAMAQLNCLWNEFNAAVAQIKTEKDAGQRKRLAQEKAFPIRRAMIRQLGQVQTYLLASVTTWGGFGNVTNWQQHLIPMLLDEPGKELATLIGEELPEDVMRLPCEYAGASRLIVPTIRSHIGSTDSLCIKAIVLSSSPVVQISLHWRTMGSGAFAEKTLRHVARGVYKIILSSDAGRDLEYYVEARLADRSRLVWPPTAPALNQTVVVLP